MRQEQKLFDREEVIEFDPRQRQLYLRKDPRCIYPRWPRWIGRARGNGEFALVAVRQHYLEQGYSVWVSEPELDERARWVGYIAVSFPGKRAKMHRAYMRLADLFGNAKLEVLNKEADQTKNELKGNRAGGDPDLFVFKGSGKTRRFFVEVKYEAKSYQDRPNPTQRAVFPLLRKHLGCPVVLARLRPCRPA